MLPIGGLKEKLLAAHRGGIDQVLIPHENERDLVEIPKNIKQSLDIRPVRWIDEVLELALVARPEPRSEDDEATQDASPPVDEAKKPDTGVRTHH